MANENGIDKNALYGKMLERDERRFRFGEKAKHMALDIPEDDVNDIRVDKSHRGMGWKELLAIGTVAAGGLLGWKGLDTLNKPTPAAVAPATPGVGPVDSEYEVRFYDRDGKPIIVPHISTKPK